MDTLVLNRAYEPVDRICWQKAITLWILGKVQILEEYDDWTVRSVTFEFKVPAVVRFVVGILGKRKGIKFSRENVYTRDKGLCGYCGLKVTRADATFDHVLPRSQGGTARWDNIVIACFPCNQKKGGRTPEQAQMRLRVKPQKPTHLPEVLRLTFPQSQVPEKWKTYLTSVAYWHGELIDG